MFLGMDMIPTPFDPESPLGNRRAIIRRNPEDRQEIEMVEAVWGSDPRFGDGDSYRFIRSEGRTFPSHRCLIAASEFQMRVAKKRYRVTLDDGNFFYLAGVWAPPMAEWPLNYRIVTVAANREVEPYQDRHGAIILRRDVMKWLDGTMDETDILITPPARTFRVAEIGATGAQAELAL